MGERAGDMSPSQAGSNASSPSESDPAVIEEEIEATREEMSETIEAIQSRLAPEHLAEQAKGAVGELASQATAAAREATVGKAQQVAVQTRDTAQSVKGSLSSTVTQNPVPVALAAIGIVWVWKQRSSSSGSSSRSHFDAYEVGSGQRGQSGGPPQEMAGQVVAQLHERTDQMQQQAQGVWQMVDANPLVAGALATMLGGVTGLIIPETEKEHQLMGETRDRLMNDARDQVVGAGNQVVGHLQERVQEVAEQAVETVMDKAQGVMPKSGDQAGTSSGSPPQR